jgi:hypothetical protein
VLINEKAIQRISHNKEKQEVMVFALDGGISSPNIKDVEEVFYVNDVQAVEHLDKGSKVEKLEQTIAACKAEIEYCNKQWQNATNIERRIYLGLFDVVAEQMDRKEKNRSWEHIEREYKEAKKNYEQYFRERERLSDEYKTNKT